MTQKNRRVYYWAAVIGAFLSGLPSYAFINSWPLMVIAFIGSIMGLLWAVWAIKMLDSAFSHLWYFGLTGFFIGVIAGSSCIVVIGIFTQWFEGWAFVLWVASSLIGGSAGLLGGLIGGWKLKKFWKYEARTKRGDMVLAIAAGVCVLLFVMIPTFVLFY